MKKFISAPDLTIIIITFVLFGIALITQGITHDFFLEAGILLVSIKLIMMNHKSILNYKMIMKELQEIKKSMEELKKENRK